MCSGLEGLIAGNRALFETICPAGSPLLSRARQVGPHAFVELSLFPSDPVLEAAVPPLKTPFQAQTFCPEFHQCRRLQTVLDARMVRAFTTQAGHVWMCLTAHAGPSNSEACSRRRMLAAADSAGGQGGLRLHHSVLGIRRFLWQDWCCLPGCLTLALAENQNVSPLHHKLLHSSRCCCFQETLYVTTWHCVCC